MAGSAISILSSVFTGLTGFSEIESHPLARWWERGVRLALCLSIILIGTGGMELPLVNNGISSWSISRTTFFFWLIYRGLIYRKGEAFRRLRPALPLAVFFGAVTISLFPVYRDLGDYRYLFFAVAHCIMVLDILRDDKSQRFLILALGLAPGVVLARGIAANPLVLDFSQMNRLQYPLDHANTAGHLLAMSFALCLAVTFWAKGRLRLAAGASACAQLVAVLLTYSRGAWLALAAGIFFLAWRLGARKEIFVLLALTGALVFYAHPLQQRLASIFDARADPAASERLKIMGDTLRVGIDHPVLGVGYGRGRLKASVRATAASETKPHEVIWHAHNIYLELFATTGLVGLGAFAWLLGSSFCAVMRAARDAVDRDRILTLGIAASAVGFMVCGLTDVSFHHHETRLFFFTLLALMLLKGQRWREFDAKVS